jgi:tungstate transport system substrate-binding protein
MSAVLVAIALAAWASKNPATAEDRFITIASTTSTQNSGLFDHILPKFTAATGIEARIVAVGTGQAIRLAERGDADVLLVHHKPSEEKFVADGFGVKRFDVMFNDFVVVGPRSDPAEIGGLRDAPAALTRIAAARAAFASRADDSGTHKLELALWRDAGVDAGAASGDWYRETGSGMGATLNTASAIDGYALTDRGTWIGFGNKGDLAVLVEGDERLFNQYGVILVDPARHPHVKARDGRTFVDWLISAPGQAAIAGFTIDGQQLFFPNTAGNRS